MLNNNTTGEFNFDDEEFMAANEAPDELEIVHSYDVKDFKSELAWICFNLLWLVPLEGREDDDEATMGVKTFGGFLGPKKNKIMGPKGELVNEMYGTAQVVGIRDGETDPWRLPTKDSLTADHQAAIKQYNKNLPVGFKPMNKIDAVFVKITDDYGAWAGKLYRGRLQTGADWLQVQAQVTITSMEVIEYQPKHTPEGQEPETNFGIYLKVMVRPGDSKGYLMHHPKVVNGYGKNRNYIPSLSGEVAGKETPTLISNNKDLFKFVYVDRQGQVNPNKRAAPKVSGMVKTTEVPEGAVHLGKIKVEEEDILGNTILGQKEVGNDE